MQTLTYALTVLIACGAIGATHALAEPAEGARPKVPPKTPAERFAAHDTDGDGSLSPDEMKAWGKARQAERKERRGGGGPGGDKAPAPEPTEE